MEEFAEENGWKLISSGRAGEGSVNVNEAACWELPKIQCLVRAVTLASTWGRPSIGTQPNKVCLPTYASRAMDGEQALASSSPTEAPERPLPATHFYSVEYPGYVQHPSVPLVVRNLGGTSKLENAFKRTAARNEALLELNLRYGDPYAHPIPGDIVGTSNILLKVTKRKRRRVDDDGVVGDYIAEPLGVILKTARFRSEFGGRSYCDEHSQPW